MELGTRGRSRSLTPARIWLIGGTQESATLAQAIAQAQLPCLISVTTATARSLYPMHPGLQIWVGRLTAAQMAQFLALENICAILDASHPYATEISQQAIAAATTHQLPYLRYERPRLDTSEAATGMVLDSFSSLLTSNCFRGERVLLTVGYRPLPLFQPWQDQATWFARILPSIPALSIALEAGFTPDRLLALRPPISLALETALWQQWRISLVVTKASGTAGGEDIKQQVAAALGVRLITIARPTLNYPQQTSEVSVAVQFCQQALRQPS